jgi:hypothetical protein
MKGIVTLVFLLVGGLASQLAGQQPHSVQTVAPAINMAGSALPVNPDPEAGRGVEIKSTTSEAIGGARALEAGVPSGAGGSVQSTEAEIKPALRIRTDASTGGCGARSLPIRSEVPSSLTPAEIEELKDGK